MSTEFLADQPVINSNRIEVALPVDEALMTIDDVLRRMDGLSPEKRALFIARLKKGGAEDLRMRILPRPMHAKHSPLSFAQQRLYFLNTYEPDNPSYNMPSALRLEGQLDYESLRKSIGEIIRRHEVLRTTFAIVEGQPVQRVSPATNFLLPLTDLSQLPQNEREPLAKGLATGEALTPFDLHRGPLFRAQLLRLGERDHILLLTMHHIISDGESVGILTKELATLYSAFTINKPSPFGELPIQYADFARWQRERLRGETMREQLNYWKNQLDGVVPVIDLPTDRPRPAVKTHRGAAEYVEIPASLTRALKHLSRTEQVTLFITLLSAFKVLLYRLSAQDDIAVGSGIIGRNQPETEGLIGFFINTLVLRTRLSGNPTFQEVLGRVREVVLGAFAHQELPFEKIVEELKPERDSSHSPMFQVMFSLQIMSPEAIEFSGLTISALDYEFGTSKFDMILSLFETTEGISGYFEYNKDLFDAATIKRMLTHYLRILDEVVAQPQQPIIHIRFQSDDAFEPVSEVNIKDTVEEFDFLF